MASLLSLSSDLLSRCNAFYCLPAFVHSVYMWSLKFNLLSTLTPCIYPSQEVMADFFRRKNQHDAFIQFAQFLVDLWNVC